MILQQGAIGMTEQKEVIEQKKAQYKKGLVISIVVTIVVLAVIIIISVALQNPFILIGIGIVIFLAMFIIISFAVIYADYSSYWSCPSCDILIHGRPNFCPECGRKFLPKCHSCKKYVDFGRHFCSHCGA